jgi:hypothetical protein
MKITLKRIAILFLIFQAGYNVVKYTNWSSLGSMNWVAASTGFVGGSIGACIGDPRVFILLVGVAILSYRERKAVAKK